MGPKFVFSIVIVRKQQRHYYEDNNIDTPSLFQMTQPALNN